MECVFIHLGASIDRKVGKKKIWVRFSSRSLNISFNVSQDLFWPNNLKLMMPDSREPGKGRAGCNALQSPVFYRIPVEISGGEVFFLDK